MKNAAITAVKTNGFDKDGMGDGLISGVFANGDGTFTALTFTQSKTFKTEGGARRWYAKRTGR